MDYDNTIISKVRLEQLKTKWTITSVEHVNSLNVYIFKLRGYSGIEVKVPVNSKHPERMAWTILNRIVI